MEYIFNGHPPNQPTITQTRLNKWYKNLFDEAANNQKVVYDVHHKICVYTEIVSLHFIIQVLGCIFGFSSFLIILRSA